MKQIPLRPELAPRSLEKAQRERIDWSEYSTSEEGYALRQAKSDEQGGLCGYCECQLSSQDGILPKGVSHIDHFYPRNRQPLPHPELTFEWGNLVLSCLQGKSCGRYKDKQPIPSEQLVNPHTDNPRDFITFICSTEDNRDVIIAQPVPGLNEAQLFKARNTIKAFQLNTVSLEQRRMNAVWSYRAQIDELSKLMEYDEFYALAIEEWASLLPELESQPFCSSLVAYAKAQGLSFSS